MSLLPLGTACVLNVIFTRGTLLAESTNQVPPPKQNSLKIFFLKDASLLLNTSVNYDLSRDEN